MTATYWSKFFWSDWESDEALKMCSPGAQGLWMRMLCVCAQGEGYLVIAGAALGPADMVRITGWRRADVNRWWAELAQWGVFSTDGRGRVYCRRMTRDAKKAATARQNGRLGGNPSLGKTRRIRASDKPKPTYSPGVQNPESRIPPTPHPGGSDWEEEGRATWTGPPEVRACVAAAGGEALAGYLDVCGWADGRVVSENRFVLDTLRRESGEALAAMGVGVG